MHKHLLSLHLWLIEGLFSQKTMWKEHLILLNNLFSAFPQLLTVETFEGMPWLHSLCKQPILNKNIPDSCNSTDFTSIVMERCDTIQPRINLDPLSLDGVIADLAACCNEQFFTRQILPYISTHHFTSSLPDQRSSLEILTLLLYDAIQCDKEQTGIVLTRALSASDAFVKKQCLLALNELRDLIIEDHMKSSSVFATQKCESIRSNKTFSEGSQVLCSFHYSTSWKSPFDIVLERLHISLEVLLKATSSLQLPLTSLLWVHSCTLPQIASSRISSWNTIINYSSFITSNVEDSFDDKRMRRGDTVLFNPLQSSDIFRLNEKIVNDYLAVNNPHAAMAITRSGQVGQQLLIQCLTNYQGFTNTLQTFSFAIIVLIHRFSAYSALFSNQKITSAAMKALGIQDEEVWICWPWRQMTEWKGSKELEKTLEPSLEGLLLRMEMEYRNPLNSWEDVMNEQWMRECRLTIAKQCNNFFLCESVLLKLVEM